MRFTISNMQGKPLTLFFGLMFVGGAGAHYLHCYSPIRIWQGLIQGGQLLATNGDPYCAYRGIPFAKPPKGELRFQPPQAGESWSGILNATKDSVPCPQINSLDKSTSYEEDCLKLNVYTKRVSRKNGIRKQALPVMVFIHGGGFQFGMGGIAHYDPSRLMEESIVIVSIQYRCGVFGFLSTGDSATSGNFGLLDQVQALKWVQQNIADFGGDPRRVTIFGESAGAASVLYHIVSPASKGLFRAAIAQSGTALNHWAIQSDPLEYARQLGRALGCHHDHNFALVDCLRHVEVKDIIDTTVSLGWTDFPLGPMVPVLENPAYGRFLTKNPWKALNHGEINEVPLIIGTNQDEGGFLFLYNFSAASIFDTIDANFYNELQPDFLGGMTRRKIGMLALSYAVKGEYFDKIDVNDRAQVVSTAIQIVSDESFKAATSETITQLSRRNTPVYVYSLEYAGDVSQTNFSGHKDVIHTHDLLFLFNTVPLSERDQSFSRNLVKKWTNFAYYLNPNPDGSTDEEWTPTGANHLRYYELAETNSMTQQSDFDVHRNNFWNILVPYYINPYI